ncbi:MAG: hypothetical protein OZ919_06905 [Xanthomonadaceae bacterium]|nr:hypothetical protein [Xanthomonadaceae bacterium]
MRRIIIPVCIARCLPGAACAPTKVKVYAKCNTKNVCEAGAEAEWALQRSGTTSFKSGSTFSASELYFDISGTSIPVTANSGTIFVIAKLADGSTAANTFSWTKSGTSLIPSNPAAIDAWLANYDGVVVSIETELQDIVVAQVNGNNTFAAVAMHNSSSMGSASASWYYGGNPGDPKPPTQEQ